MSTTLQDPRQRTRVYLLTYLDTVTYPELGYIYLDDAETEVEYAVMYAKPNVPLKLLYYGNKNYDVIFCVGEPDNTPKPDWTGATYKYTEQVPVSICAIDKDGLTATLALWQAERKLRTIVETYFLGSLRTLRRTKPAQRDLGGFFEYQADCEITYQRSTATEPTYPTVTWGASGDPDGTYTIPNVTSFSQPILANNTRHKPAGRMGSKTQKLGVPSYAFTMQHDLTVAPASLSWKRPQATDPKTDVLDWQVFNEILFDGQVDQTYQTFNLGWGTTLKVTLESVTPELSGDTKTLTTTWYVYNDESAATYKTFFGINP